MSSPVRRQYERYQLRRRSALAMAEALARARVPEKARVPQDPRWLMRKARRLESCAISRHARIVTPPQGESRLFIRSPRACRQRICPLCEHRRAAATRAKVEGALDIARDRHPHSRALFLTLTSTNRPLAELGSMFAAHIGALDRFWRNPRLKDATLGHLTMIEIAVRGTEEAPFWGVHSHAIVLVDKHALSDRRYIAQPVWAELWRRALRVAYKPVVDIRLVRGPDGSPDPAAVRGALRELCKYCVATEGLFDHGGRGMRVDPRVAAALAAELHRKRLMRFDRVWQDAFKELRKREIERSAEAKSTAGPADTDPAPAPVIPPEAKEIER